MSRVIVVATFKIKPEAMAQAREELLKLIEPTRTQDAGCIRYELHQSTSDPSAFAFIEEWESQELLNAHLQTEHLQAFLKKAEEMFSESQVNIYTKIA